MPFYNSPPSSTCGGSNPDYEFRGCTNDLSLDELESVRAPTPDTGTTRNVSQNQRTERARSQSFSDTTHDSSDDDIHDPVTPPPILNRLSRYVKCAKANPKPYQRDDPNIFVSRLFDNQLSHNDSMGSVDVQGVCLFYVYPQITC
jgi:hypothetical protein